MKTLTLVQGSPEWEEVRGKYLTASEAPIMMGASPNMSRDDLLKYKTTGDKAEVTRFQQFIFDKGHQLEALARPIAETRLDDELYPVTGIVEIAGLALLASYDGMTMMEDNHWEHKQFNRELFELVKSGGELEGKHYWQLEHQLLVNGNDSCVFAVSDGTEQNYAELVYQSRSERRQLLILGWKQFLADLEGYQPIVIPAKAIAEVMEELPEITYSTKFRDNALTLTSNLDIFKIAAHNLVEQSKKKLESDQDFANAEARIKSCETAEGKIAILQEMVVGEVADISKFVKDLSAISELLRQCRLNEEKQVKQRKEQIKLDIKNLAVADFEKHVSKINELIALNNVSFPRILLPLVSVDWMGAMKNKRTIKSLQESVNNALAAGKIEANRIAGIIDSNLAKLNILAVGYDSLFADIQQLIVKDAEYVEMVANSRIAEHKKKEQARIDAAAEVLVAEKFEQDQPAAVQSTSQASLTQSSSVQQINQASSSGGSYYKAPPAHNSNSVATGMTEYQRGMVKGLELALNIFSHCQKNNASFSEAINAFINSDSIPKMEEAA